MKAQVACDRCFAVELPMEVRARGVERATRVAVRQPLDFTNDVAERVVCSISLLVSRNPAPA